MHRDRKTSGWKSEIELSSSIPGHFDRTWLLKCKDCLLWLRITIISKECPCCRSHCHWHGVQWFDSQPSIPLNGRMRCTSHCQTQVTTSGWRSGQPRTDSATARTRLCSRRASLLRVCTFHKRGNDTITVFSLRMTSASLHYACSTYDLRTTMNVSTQPHRDSSSAQCENGNWSQHASM